MGGYDKKMLVLDLDGTLINTNGTKGTVFNVNS